MKRHTAHLFFVLGLFAVASASAQTIVYVDDDAPPGGDGQSWATAYADLQSALAPPNDGNGELEIRVAGGTYKPSAETEPGDPRTVTFTMRSGVALRGGYRGLAGGGDPDDRDVVAFVTVLSGDIGIVGDDSDNAYHVVTSSGTDASAVLDGLTITGGRANGPGIAEGLQGAGLYNVSGNPVLVNCTFSENRAGDYDFSGRGGGMYNSQGNPTLLNCTFFRNHAAGDFDGGGGGMYNDQGSPTLANCAFIRNASPFGGGIYNGFDSSPTLTNCTFVANTAGDGYGAGLYNGGSPTLTNCTFVLNQAEYAGGGIYNGGSPTLTNCILWNNIALGEPSQVSGDQPSMITYSCIQGGWEGTGNIDADPLLIEASGSFEYDLHLQSGSPCINTGDNSAVVSGVDQDFEGDARIQHCRVDMGVDETPYLGQDCNANGVADACDLDGGTSPDCNANGIPDECEIEIGWLQDCNSNGVLDECDISGGTSQDDDGNGIPDECDGLLPPILYVDDDATGGRNDGTTWADAMLELADALRVANSPAITEVRVAGGTYRPSERTSPDEPRTAAFVLLNDLAIRGGYRGLAGGGDPNDRDVAAFTSILSGDVGVAGDDSDNCYHVVTGSGTDATAVLDGFTITAGNAAGGDYGRGGGVYNLEASPTLTDCTFYRNSAAEGGGIYNKDNSRPLLTNCVFRGNSAVNEGGGMDNNDNSNPMLINCTFIGNSAGFYGGGMCNNRSSATLTDCVFHENSALDGGGIFTSQECALTLTNCAFVGNMAGHWGGGMLIKLDSTAMYTNCTFTGNSAAQWGGGVYSSESILTYTNCDVSGNSAGAIGGGMFHSTLYSATVTNCIVWGNTAPMGPQLHPRFGATATYSCIQGGWTGVGNINADPLFVDADGPDNTFGTSDDDLHLQYGSPCINAGTNDAPGLPDTDLDGYPRILCGRVDMGVYEHGIGDHDCDGDIDLEDFGAWGDCMGGPANDSLSESCAAYEFLFDGHIDLRDFARFQDLFTER